MHLCALVYAPRCLLEAQDISDIVVYISKIIHQCVAVPFLQLRALHTFLLTCIVVSCPGFPPQAVVEQLLSQWTDGHQLVVI